MAYDDENDRRAYQRKYYHEKIKPKRKEAKQQQQDRDRKILVSLRLRSSLAGRISGLFHTGVAMGTTSHKTPSEFYAELLFKGLETMSANPDVDEALQYLRAVSATDAIGAHRKEAQAAFSRVRTELQELMQIDADAAARHYYWTTVKSFTDMSPNVWRNWFLEQMHGTFPQFAKAIPKGVGLGLDQPRSEPKSKKSRTRA